MDKKVLKLVGKLGPRKWHDDFQTQITVSIIPPPRWESRGKHIFCGVCLSADLSCLKKKNQVPVYLCSNLLEQLIFLSITVIGQKNKNIKDSPFIGKLLVSNSSIAFPDCKEFHDLAAWIIIKLPPGFMDNIMKSGSKGSLDALHT